MGTTENRLIIHQYSKPGAVPVGVVYGNVVAHSHMFLFSLNSPSFSTLDPKHAEICFWALKRWNTSSMQSEATVSSISILPLQEINPWLKCTQNVWYREVICGISFYSKGFAGNELTSALIKHSDKTRAHEGTLSILSPW